MIHIKQPVNSHSDLNLAICVQWNDSLVDQDVLVHFKVVVRLM